MRLQKIVPLAVLVTLGAGVACKKPAPAPVVDPAAEAAKAKAEAEAKAQAEAEARRKAEEEAAAKRKAEAEEAKRKAEAEEAKRKADAETAYKAAAEAALKDINFDFDKHAIREADKAKLQAIAEFMKKNAQATVKVEGHCDERGTVEYNLALGEKRAAAAQAYLVNLGVEQGRLSTISFGKEKPKVQGKDQESYLINRRAEFKLQ